MPILYGVYVMINIFEVVIYILTSIMVVQFFIGFKKRIPILKYIKAIILMAGSATVFGCLPKGVPSLLLQMLVIILIIKMLYQTKMINILLFVIAYIVSHSFISEIITKISQINNRIYNIHIPKDFAFVDSLIIMMLILLISIPIKKFTVIGTGKVNKKSVISLLLILVIDEVIIVTFGENLMVVEGINIFKRNAMVYEVLCVALIIELATMVYLVASRERHREQEAVANQYLEEQKQHYEYLSKREYETKKFRHDISSHMNLLAQLCKKNDIESIEKYLKEINVHIEAFKSKINSHNAIADAVLNRYYAECESRGIELQVEGHFPNECNIQAFDICTILSNLLDNALDSELMSGGNEIKVAIRNTDDSQIMLLIENDFQKEPEIINGKILTSKKNKKEHGFGLENVKDCVERNNGHTNITKDNGKFRVWICMDN